MLILKHRIGEDAVVTLPDRREIVVTYLGLYKESYQGCIGYTSPRDIIIDRRRIHQRKQAEHGSVVAALPNEDLVEQYAKRHALTAAELAAIHRFARWLDGDVSLGTQRPEVAHS